MFWWWAFHVFVAGHIVTGATGLVSFWGPIVAKKGGRRHRSWGRVFTNALLVTGGFAILISACTLIAPAETHPHIPDIALVRGIFGWMMQYLAVLTVNLAWYGKVCIDNKRDHARNRDWRNLALQWLVLAASLNTALQGWRIDQPLMIGMSAVGIATFATNMRFILKAAPGPNDWLREHIKGLVGAGISVYTAFFAFGAVRIMPEIALHPGLWAVPLCTGIGLILYHWRGVEVQYRARLAAAAERRRMAPVGGD